MQQQRQPTAPPAHTLVPGKHRFVSTERIEKFTSKTYWTDCNLTSVENRLCSKECVTGTVDILKWTQPQAVFDAVRPGYERYNLTFDAAKKIFDSPQDAEKFCAPNGNPVEKASIGDKFGPWNRTFWFKATVKVDSVRSFNNSKVDIRLAWNTGSEGLVYNEDGTVLGGVTGEGRDFIPLWWDVSSGENLNLTKTVYIEMVCSARMGDGMPTFIDNPNPDRHFTLDRAEIMLIDRMVRRLRVDMELFHSFATTEGVPDLLAEDALVWGNRVINAFIHDQPETWPVAAQIAEDFFTKHSTPRPNDQRDVIASQGNCHIDLAWLWSKKETRRKIARSWSSQLLLAHAPDRQGGAFYRFVASQAVQFQWLAEDYPELFERVKNEVNKPQDQSHFTALGAMWVEADGNLPTGESFIRQFLVGQNYFKKHFGKKSDIFWLPDTFGYSGQLPQISTHCGCKYFVSQKLSWNLINKPPHTSFHWKGIDGVEDDSTQLLSHFPPQDDYCCQVTVNEICVKSAAAKQNRDIGRANNVLMLAGDGDGGGGPKEPLLLRWDRFEKMTSTPMKLSTTIGPQEFFERLVADEKRLPQLQTHYGELYFEMHRGTFSVHRRLKHRVNQLEDLLRTAESTAAYAALVSRLNKSSSSSYQHPTEQLWNIWSDVLISQFHDIVPGSSITVVYTDTFAMLDRAIVVANEIISNAIKFVVSGSGSSSSSMIANMTPVQVDGIPSYSIISSQELQKQKQSAFSSASNKIQVTNLDQDGFKIENEKMVCVIEQDGRISSYKLKNSSSSLSSEYVGTKSKSWLHWNLYDDVPLFWDAWDVEIYHMEKPLMSHGATVSKKTSVVTTEENGSVELVTELSVKHNITIEQRIVISSSTTSDITVKASIKNWANDKSKHRILKCLFGTNIVNPNAFYGTAFGAVQRPTHRNSSQDLAKFEVCADRWLDFSQAKMGLSIANNCGMRGASIHGSTIALSVLRSPTAPDPTCDVGQHDIEFILRPHDKSHFSESGVVELAASLSKPSIVSVNDEIKNTSSSLSSLINGTTSFVKTSSPQQLHVTAIKLPEYHKDDSSSSLELIVRLYETVGSFVSSSSSTIELLDENIFSSQGVNEITANLCDGLEVENLGELVISNKKKNVFVLPEFRPFQIRTIKFNLKF